MMPLVNTFPEMKGGDDDEVMDALEDTDALEMISRLLIMSRQSWNLIMLPTLFCSCFIIIICCIWQMLFSRLSLFNVVVDDAELHITMFCSSMASIERRKSAPKAER